MAEEKKTTTKKVATTKTATKTAPKKEVVKEVKATETKQTAKAENSVKKIRVTLVKSPIGYNKKQARICKTLGLGKLNSSYEIVDNECVRGMIFKVKHLVRVEELN